MNKLLHMGIRRWIAVLVFGGTILILVQLAVRASTIGLVEVVGLGASEFAFLLLIAFLIWRAAGAGERLAVASRQLEARHSAIAGLGQMALAGAATDELMAAVVHQARDVLKVEYAKVLELLPDGSLRVVAGEGWHPGVVGEAIVDSGPDSQAGYAIRSHQDIAVVDLRSQQLFAGTKLLHDHKVVSGMSIRIAGPEEPFGVLGIHSTRRRTFSEDELDFGRSLANTLAASIERQGVENAVKASEERLERIVESLVEGIMLIGPDGQVVWANAAADRILGIDRSKAAAFVRSDIWKATDVVTGAPIRDDLAPKLLAGEPVYDFALRLERVDRTELFLAANFLPRLDESGSVVNIVVSFRDVTLQRQANELRQQLLNRLVNAQEEERRRIAADIHDDSLQAIAVSVLRLGRLRRRLAEEDHALLHDVEETMQTAADRLRRLIFNLRPPSIDNVAGLESSIRDQLERLRTESNIDYSAQFDDSLDIPTEIRLIIYRVVVEALQNVRKHANAEYVWLTVGAEADGVVIGVRDDGQGFDSANRLPEHGHIGMLSMRERVELAGGHWSLTSAPNRGTEISFWLPIASQLGVGAI